MLDIKEELKHYKLIKLEENSQEDQQDKETEELKSLLNMFTKTYERISKEQYKTSNSVDEILDILEENNEINKEKQAVIKELKEQIEEQNIESNAILNTIIIMADIFDYISNYVSNSDNRNLRIQFKLVEEQLVEKFTKASITVLGRVNDEVDINIHQPIGVKWQEDKLEGIILEVVRKGYMYKGKLLRKAEIIVNRNESV